MIKNLDNVIKKYWGYDDFLPMQTQAMECALKSRDSIVVMPTGGGKSLCFQAPAMLLSGLAVVVSPLISLMKDQVDALAECGIPAARIDSSMYAREKRTVYEQLEKGQLKILYVSPERLVSEEFLKVIKNSPLSLIAVDEAHCISMWGHDFRPEYRQLGLLKKSFSNLAIHAYTATATKQVRRDIASQLQLRDPEVIVGSFDRPNLVYKVERRKDIRKQVCAVIDRHRGEAGIIYCIRRDDVDQLCEQLTQKGYSIAPYHAGMTDKNRKETQDAFIQEKKDIIVATIAFGMGIDKSNVRYVIHAAMPKSLEHYQQQSGRAGRDRLEAECCLFFSGGDYAIWKSIVEDTSSDESREIAYAKLNRIYNYCSGIACRHQAILNYFEQDLGKDNCGACDVCLGEIDSMEDSQITAQKILSCNVRLKEYFGADYTASVLIGSKEQRVLGNRHDSLSTYGLLSDHPKHVVRGWIEQLVGQGCLQKGGEYNVLTVTEKGWRVLKGNETPLLLKPVKKEKKRKVSRIEKESWQGVDERLFEILRAIRRVIADKKRIPAYIVFNDTSLRDMARRRPSNVGEFLKVNGVGEQKKEEYATVFISAIKEYCLENNVEMDQ